MGFLPQCNSTLEDEIISEDPIWLGRTFHHLGLWLCIVFGAVAVLVSFFLIFMHATHYLKPWEQRHIIRILLMVPVYATVSFLSFLYYRHAIYFEVLRDCYEAFAIASFFTLLCHYVADDLHQQKNYFRTIRPKAWVWPTPWIQKCWGGKDGIWRTPRSGLTWFNVIWTGVFQYCFIRVFMTCVAVATQAFGRYCQESLNPAFAHIWVMFIEAGAVSVAMYCLIQFYVQLKDDIREHKPLLKVAAIKLVIFLSFWQTLAISVLTGTGAIKPSKQIQTPDIKIGVPAMLLDIEMAIFAVFHLWAFSWRPYSLESKQSLAGSVPGYDLTRSDYQGGPLGFKAICEAFNPWDLVKAVGRAAKWLFVGRKTRTHDVSYQVRRTATSNELCLGAPYESNNPNFYPPIAGYEGSGSLVRPGTNLYASSDISEGQQLLRHTQGDPISRPPLQGNDSSPGSSRLKMSGGEHGSITNDMGVARSIYEEDDDHDATRSDAPGPPLPPRRHQEYCELGGGQQKTGAISVPCPDQESERPRQDRVFMPYVPPPPRL